MPSSVVLMRERKWVKRPTSVHVGFWVGGASLIEARRAPLSWLRYGLSLHHLDETFIIDRSTQGILLEFV